MKRLFDFLCRISIWALTALVLFACVFFARVFYAPLDLSFATSVIEKQVESFLPGWEASYETAKIGWDWRSVKPWITIDHIDLVDRRERLHASVPQVRIDVSFVSLFGSAGISSIYVQKPHVVITDLAGFSDATDDSSLADFFDWEGPPRPEVFRPVIEAFSRFTTRLLENAPRLEGVYFNNARVDISRGDELPDLSLAMPSFRLDHKNQKLNVTAQVDALIADQLMRLTLSGEAEPDIGELAIDIAVRDMDLKSITEGMELPEFFDYLNFPVGVDLELSLSADEGLRGARFELTLGEGYLYHSVAYPEKAIVNYGVISGALNVSEDQLMINEVDLLLGSNRVLGDGLIYWEDGKDQAGIQFDLYLDAATVSDVKKYWPIRVHPDGRPRGARAWVDGHMLGGITKNIAFKIRMNPDGSRPYLNNSAYELTFNLDDVDTFYVKTMPALEDVKGRAVLTRTAFDVFVTSGTVMGMAVGGSTAHIGNIHLKGRSQGDFDVNIEGPVRKILAMIDTKPVSISDKIAIDLDRLTGAARVNAKLSLPLLKQSLKETISYDVTAYIKAGGVTDLLGGEGLRNADLTLNVNGDQLMTSGYGDINGVPMELYWREDFKAGRADPAADTSLLVMSGSPDESDIAAFGVDITDYLKGKTRAEATFLGRNLKFRVGYFSADASDAELMIAPIGWTKPSSSPATVNGTIILSDDQGVKLEPLLVTGEDIDLTASFDFGAKGEGTYSGTVDAVKLGRNKLQAEIYKLKDTPLKVVASGLAFDLAPLLAKPLVKPDTEAVIEKEVESVDFDFDLNAETLFLQNGESLKAAALKLVFENNEPTVFNFRAKDQHGETAGLLTENNEKLKPINITSNNAGQLMRGLGLFSHMQGGSLVLEGQTDGWGKTLTLQGKLTASDTTMIAKSNLDTEVTEGVISGLDKYLEGGSINLNTIEFPFSYEKGLLDISDLKANGPSLGMTMEGQIQAAEKKINVNGVVVPAYGLNSLLGKIPLVGAIFSGGSGKGLFGITYRIKGVIDEPEVSVNPLSGLAPGFLRVLFEGRKGKVSSVEVPEETGGQKPDSKPEADSEQKKR